MTQNTSNNSMQHKTYTRYCFENYQDTNYPYFEHNGKNTFFVIACPINNQLPYKISTNLIRIFENGNGGISDCRFTENFIYYDMMTNLLYHYDISKAKSTLLSHYNKDTFNLWKMEQCL